MDYTRFEGLGTALATPFGAGGEVDRAALRRHVEFQLDGGVDFLVPCGTTGEVVTLSPEERVEVIAETVAVADGRAPVLAGAGTNSTRDAVRHTREAREAGADGILSVAPYYNRPPQEGLFRHFRAVAEEAEVAVVLYNVPSRTASNLLPETVLRLAEEVENVRGIKEASGRLDQVEEILAHRPPGFTVLSGDDPITLPLLALGGDGVISVTSNVAPAQMARLVEAAFAGDGEASRRLHFRLRPLFRALFRETNPIPVKGALELLGRMDRRVRLPLVPCTEKTLEELRRALEAAETGEREKRGNP